MVRYYGLYNSYYFNKIPKECKKELKEEEEIDWGQEADYDQGAYEDLRKAYIHSGREDPLYCKSCGLDLVLTEIRYKKKLIRIDWVDGQEVRTEYKYDSS